MQKNLLIKLIIIALASYNSHILPSAWLKNINNSSESFVEVESQDGSHENQFFYQPQFTLITPCGDQKAKAWITPMFVPPLTSVRNEDYPAPKFPQVMKVTTWKTIANPANARGNKPSDKSLFITFKDERLQFAEGSYANQNISGLTFKCMQPCNTNELHFQINISAQGQISVK